jgi:hypothetical protein
MIFFQRSIDAKLKICEWRIDDFNQVKISESGIVVY